VDINNEQADVFLKKDLNELKVLRDRIDSGNLFQTAICLKYGGSWTVW